ncbi:NAD-dependent dehydratase [Halobacteriales archaeon QS_1_68_20]|nr:MAG: NAD-dependent dehydratase [Halobacteriales archaeon QS_1_68_20]
MGDDVTHAVVTGGAGFVGSHLVDELLGSGFRVTVVDDFSTGVRRNLDHHRADDRFELHSVDLKQGLPAIEDADVVFHLASRASPGDFRSHGVDIALTNSVGTNRVLDLALEQDATVVLASTSEVYGDPEVHPQPESYVGHVSVRGARSPYDIGKRFGETLGMAYARQFDLDVRTVRIFNTYGPRMRPDDGRVVPTFVSQALSGDPLTVHGDGTQTRSFCYVSDLVTGLVEVAREPSMDGDVVNLGNDEEITILALARRIRELVDRSPEIVHVDGRPDDPTKRRPDLTRARERLDWQPTTPLDEGLRRTIEDLRGRLET